MVKDNMKKTEYKRKKGYTLAEMLMVMLIISLMILALPPVTKKIYEERYVRRLHGRYECYRNAANQIVEGTSLEGGVNSGLKVVDKCKFTVPNSSIYILVHAVGGGGGGAYVSKTPTDSSVQYTAEDYYGNSAPHLFADWVKEWRQKGNQFMHNSPDDMANLGTVTGNVATMQFGYGGLQGERISMFFSRLAPGVELEMIPGELGVAGQSTTSYKASDGTDTVVNILDKSNATSTSKELIRARGGKGGIVAGESKIWLYGGSPSDYGLAGIQARKRQYVNFVENIEGNVDEKLKSYIFEAGLTPGDGGGGAYSYINNTTSTLTYTMQDVGNISSQLSFNTYLSKNPTANTDCTKNGSNHVCQNNNQKAFSCVDDQVKENLLCKPQNGGTGAVVILW